MVAKSEGQQLDERARDILKLIIRSYVNSGEPVGSLTFTGPVALAAGSTNIVEIDKANAGMTGRERLFFSYWRQRGIQSMYLRPYFLEKMRQGAEFKTYGHWGPLEHQTVAEGVKAYLIEKGLVRQRVSRDPAQGGVERGLQAEQ